MRRILLLFAVLALTLVVASGVALALIKEGGPGHDTLIGTKGPDTLSGRGGSDRIEGRAGKDQLSGGPGNDRFFILENRVIAAFLDGGPGADVISGGASEDFLLG